MRLCPSCGYGNAGPGPRCAVCGSSLAGAPELPGKKPDRYRPAASIAAGLILLAFAAYMFFTGTAGVSPRPAAEAERGQDLSGILRSLEAMSGLRFLPDADKLKTLSLLSSPEGKVSVAAARAVGSWIRSGPGGELEKKLFEGLLSSADTAVPEGRRQAAVEAGMAAALGFPCGGYSKRISGISARLASEKDAGLRGAGFFLSAMTGSRELTGRMREELGGGDAEAGLYAACALSRLNDPEANSRLEALASGPCSGQAADAFSCLGYSMSPRAGDLLRAAAKGPSTPCSEKAKIALILREQLAIIKK